MGGVGNHVREIENSVDFHADSEEVQASTEDDQHCQISNDCTWRGVEAKNFYSTFNVFNAKPYAHKTRAPSYYAAAHQRSDVDSVPWWSESSFLANAGLVPSGEKNSADAFFDFRPLAMQYKATVNE